MNILFPIKYVLITNIPRYKEYKFIIMVVFRIKAYKCYFRRHVLIVIKHIVTVILIYNYLITMN